MCFFFNYLLGVNIIDKTYTISLEASGGSCGDYSAEQINNIIKDVDVRKLYNDVSLKVIETDIKRTNDNIKRINMQLLYDPALAEPKRVNRRQKLLYVFFI